VSYRSVLTGRESQFGEHGLISFRVDEAAELLVIFNVLWAG
jgi:hypothetical protein